MNISKDHRSTYQCYPYLTKGEFTEVCHYLDRRYCQATLGPLRRQWRLHVHTALELSFDAGPGYTTFLQITRPLDDGTATDHDIAEKMGGISLSEDQLQVEGDHVMVEMEESDKEILSKRLSRASFGVSHVKYEIHLHPTYRAPCLWFSLHNLLPGESALDIETVFRRLVPGHFADSLRHVGPVGGISIDHHPITGVPSFFVHPCALGDAMAGFDCPKEDYLMVWLGLVGGCVGLWIPSQLAAVSAG
ncbi:hypothetical protein F4820DRAFT_28535 [Hypoxylon rubiginosum]|uniref:Uncharacterized protein n=1 Tax=Hypoxylon rubiginosum TaxID=110542 RepID=A0ACB9ZCQ7_9PEZI|nr:hypothetical protein F4820DRAFT_28535 [Hypoxylon rubiginosum]